MSARSGRLRSAFAAAVAAVLAVVAAGCGSADDTSADGPVTIRFLSYNYGTPCCNAAIQELVDRFQAAHTDIKVQPEAVAVADVLTKLRSETAAGTTPDVAQLGWSKAAEARTSLPIVPVQDIPSGQDWKSATEGIYPNVLDAVRNPNGKVDIMPFSMSVPILYYNADLFRAAGLDPDKPPTTIDQVKDAASAIARSGTPGVYVALADPGKSDYMTQSVMNSQGGGVVDAKGNVTVDSAQSVRALERIRDLTVSGAQPNVSANDAQAAFAGGKLGMLIFTTAAMSANEKAAAGKFELRTAAFPSFDGGKAKPTFSGAGLAVFAKDKRKQRAAWEFVRYLTSPEGFTILTKSIGYLPLRPAIVTDPAYLGDYFRQNNRLLPSLNQIGDVTPYRYFPGNRANQAVVILQDEGVEPIVIQGREAQPTLTKVAEKIRDLTK
ncbi:ABC transporter substrate-binding protein [Nocardia arizonensis]|uniref:ABC transporter substrate-binding protein n=1 Tax=Nocardia arizonensis TaxID=1141647 RepID=UPI0006CFE09A|nr:ABC transporter substrate-binding protein [Nocardia arizonensis]